MTRGPSIKTINRNSEVVTFSVKCGNCKLKRTYNRKETTIFAWTSDTQEYGSSGTVILNCKCKGCGKNLTIEMESW
jgi:hypothetical protein